jgi:hypothetical protein
MGAAHGKRNHRKKVYARTAPSRGQKEIIKIYQQL